MEQTDYTCQEYHRRYKACRWIGSINYEHNLAEIKKMLGNQYKFTVSAIDFSLAIQQELFILNVNSGNWVVLEDQMGWIAPITVYDKNFRKMWHRHIPQQELLKVGDWVEVHNHASKFEQDGICKIVQINSSGNFRILNSNNVSEWISGESLTKIKLLEWIWSGELSDFNNAPDWVKQLWNDRILTYDMIKGGLLLNKEPIFFHSTIYKHNEKIWTRLN